MKEIEKDNYLDLVKKKMPKSKHIKTMVRAFVVGGFICCIGQLITDLITKFNYLNLEKEQIMASTTMILITITGILTGFGIYDKIGNYGGAGSIVPITGFANSIVSPAIEHKREGVVLGLCTNMFSIAGPVIVFGVAASVLVGIITLIFA